MTDEQIKYERIEQYWAGLLSQEDLLLFQKEMQANPTFAAEVQLHQELQAMLGDKQAVVVQDKLKTIGQAYLQGQKEKSATKPEAKIRQLPRTKQWWLMAAAIAVLLVVAAGIYLNFNQPKSNEQLFAQYYETPALLAKSRATTPNQDELLQQAYTYYERQNHEAAASFFQEIIVTGKAEVSVYFYAGISQLTKEPTDENLAIQHFKSVISLGNNAYVDAAKWLTALTYLKQDKREAAKEILVELVENGRGKYQAKAVELLGAL